MGHFFQSYFELLEGEFQALCLDWRLGCVDELLLKNWVISSAVNTLVHACHMKFELRISGCSCLQNNLVGGLVAIFLFSHILGISTSQLTFICFRGVQTTNQIMYSYYSIAFNSSLTMWFFGAPDLSAIKPPTMTGASSHTKIRCWLVPTGAAFGHKAK